MFWKKGYQDPKPILETMIAKPKAVEKKLLWNQNCVFEIKIDLTLVGNGTCRRVLKTPWTTTEIYKTRTQ